MLIMTEFFCVVAGVPKEQAFFGHVNDFFHGKVRKGNHGIMDQFLIRCKIRRRRNNHHKFPYIDATMLDEGVQDTWMRGLKPKGTPFKTQQFVL